MPKTSPTVPVSAAVAEVDVDVEGAVRARRAGGARPPRAGAPGDDLGRARPCRGPGGSSPRSSRAASPTAASAPPSTSRDQVVADGPLLQRVEGDRDGVLDLVGVVGLGDAQPRRRKPRTGCAKKSWRSARDTSRAGSGGGQGRGHQRACAGAVGPRGPRAGEREAVEGEGGRRAAQSRRRRGWPRRRAAAGGGSARGSRTGAAAVRSSASSSSPSGTAGGRSAPVCSPRPV